MTMNQTINQFVQHNPSDTAIAHGVPARLLDIYWSHPVALAPQVSLEIIETPEIFTVPGCKRYVQGLIYWQNRWIPALNIKALLTGIKEDIKPRYALIVLYRYPNSQAIHYGAILLENISTLAAVKEEDSTSLPDNSDMWQHIADACFTHEGQSIPILNMQSLFCYSYDWED